MASQRTRRRRLRRREVAAIASVLRERDAVTAQPVVGTSEVERTVGAMARYARLCQLDAVLNVMTMCRAFDEALARVYGEL
jgi:stage V sporulation protein SpoVS